MLLTTVEDDEVGGDLIPIIFGGRTAGTTWSTLGGEQQYYIIVWGRNGCAVRWCSDRD